MTDYKVNKMRNLEGVRIGFRNFAGKEGKFNPAGRRNFCVFLNEEVEVSEDFPGEKRITGRGAETRFYAPLSEVLALEGWNVRWLEPKNPDDDKQAYLSVAVSYSKNPPKILLITGKNKTLLDEDTVNILDWADIENVDLVIRPYNWEVQGKIGVKAYLKSMYVTIAQDEFESKYRDVPDTAVQPMEDDD